MSESLCAAAHNVMHAAPVHRACSPTWLSSCLLTYKMHMTYQGWALSPQHPARPSGGVLEARTLLCRFRALQELYGLWFAHLQDNIYSVREDSAVALGNAGGQATRRRGPTGGPLPPPPPGKGLHKCSATPCAARVQATLPSHVFLVLDKL